MSHSTVEYASTLSWCARTRRYSIVVAAFWVLGGFTGCGGSNEKNLVKVDMPATGNEFSIFFAGTWESAVTEQETTDSADKKEAQDRYVFTYKASQYAHGQCKSYHRDFKRENWSEGFVGSWRVESVDPDRNEARIVMVSMKAGMKRYALHPGYEQYIEKKVNWVITLTSATQFGLEAGDLARSSATDLYRGFARQGFLATPTYTKILDAEVTNQSAGQLDNATADASFGQDSTPETDFGSTLDSDSNTAPPGFVPRNDDRFKATDLSQGSTDSIPGSIPSRERRSQAADSDSADKVSATDHLLGSYIGTYDDRLTLKMILLEDGRVEYFKDGEKLELLANPIDGQFFVRELRWLVNDGALEMKVLGGITYYQIKDNGDIVGPITKLKDRRRIVVPFAERVTFKRIAKPTSSAGSELPSRDADPFSKEQPARISRDPEIALDAEVGFEVGDIAPPINGLDVNGVRFNLSNYRGQVVVLNFWGDWSEPCREMHPHERSLVANMKGKPFVLLGVNSDPKVQVQETIKRENITWRSFWDGGTTRGPISRAYEIRDWPTIYVIDHLGVIRYKQLRGPEILKAVETLVAKIAPAPAKPHPLRGFADSTGQFKILARFIEFKGGKAHLKKIDGTVIALSIDSLSKADQRYIRELLNSR